MRVHVFVLLAMIVAVMDAAPRSQYYHYPAAGYYAGVAPPNYYYHPSYLNNPYHQRGPARPSLFNGFNGFHDFQLPPNPFRFIYEQVTTTKKESIETIFPSPIRLIWLVC